MKLIPAWLISRAASPIIRRAMRTPYFHLSNPDGSPYMSRYWLFRLGRAKDDDNAGLPGQDTTHAKIAGRIHWIHSSDDGGAFHDHPWSFVTIILRGGYYELTPIDSHSTRFRKRWHGAGSVNFRRATDWHRLVIDRARARGDTITLFISFPKRQSWGFRVAGKKVPWRRYLSVRDARNQVT